MTSKDLTITINGKTAKSTTPKSRLDWEVLDVHLHWIPNRALVVSKKLRNSRNPKQCRCEQTAYEKD